MSRELKLGLISVIAIAGMIWGFQYMKGKNILNPVSSYEVVYGNIEGLKKSAPVEINGYAVGSVADIDLSPDNVKEMLITFDVEGTFNLPKNTVAILAADNSLVGSKKIILRFDNACSGADCAQSGDRFESGTRGMLEALLGKDELSSYVSSIGSEIGPIMDTVFAKLSDKDAQNSITQSVVKLEESMVNMASMTKTMNSLLTNSYIHLNKTFENMATVTTSLANTNDELETMITNFANLSTQLAEADLGATLKKTGTTFDNTNELLDELKVTATKATESMGTVSELLDKVKSGDGALAKLLNDPEIYNNLEETTKHLSLLLQDMRLNPKRYVRLSVFGRKGNAYTPPQEDPAFDKKKQN